MKKSTMTTLFRAFLFCALLACCIIPAQAQRTYSRSMGESYSHRGSSDVLDIRMRYSGSLKNQIRPEEENRVRMLIIDGDLNSDDISVIRRILKRTRCEDRDGRSIDNYVDLDLSRCRIVYGGSFYYSSYRTERDCIGQQMFYDCDALRSIILPERLDYIYAEAFSYCDNLEDVMVPYGVRAFGDKAFYNCRNLRRVDIPDGLSEIRNSCFEGCDKLSYVTLPRTLESIGSKAFYGCDISSIGVTDRLTTIGDCAFSRTKLTALYIPSNCKIDGSLGYLPKLTKIEVGRGNPYYASEDGVLYSSDFTKLYFYPQARSGSVVVPDGVEEVSNYAFYSSKVTNVDLPNSCRSIGKGAFESCSSLTGISFSENCTSFDVNCFMGCSRLTSFTFPEGTTILPACMFQESGLTEVTIPSTVTAIGDLCFRDCTGLTKVNWGDGVQTIRKEAFRNCKSLRSLTIPSTVTTIGELCFRDCMSLFDFQIGAGVTRFEKETFRNCQALTEFTAPSTLTTMDKDVFLDCKGLVKVTLNEGLRNIAESEFRDCPLLSVLIIPSTVIKIEKKFISGCKNITRLEVNAVVPPVLDDDCQNKSPLFVPMGSVSAYQTANKWKNYKNVQGF